MQAILFYDNFKYLYNKTHMAMLKTEYEVDSSLCKNMSFFKDI